MKIHYGTYFYEGMILIFTLTLCTNIACAAKEDASFSKLEYTNQNAADEAMAKIDEAIKKNPTNEKAYFKRAVSYQIKHDPTKAIADYSKAIELNPRYMEAYHNRGAIYLGMHDFDRAIADFNKAIEIQPSDKVYCNLGIAYISKEDYDRALLNYSKAIDVNPHNMLAYYYRALVYYEKKDYANSWNDVNLADSLGMPIDPKFLDDLKKASGRER